MNNKHRRLLPILLLFLAFISANPYSKMPIGNTTTNWILYALIFLLFFYETRKMNVSFTKKGYWVVALYLSWALIGIIRGMFVVENYWESKALVNNSFIILMPFCVYAFNSPYIVNKTLRLWIKIAFPAFFIFFYWMVGLSQFYLGPIYLVLCFLPIIKSKKWALAIGFVGLLLLTYNIEDLRSQFMKAVMSFMVMTACFFHEQISDRLLRMAHWGLYILPVCLLFLGLSGRFNIFEDINKNYQNQFVSDIKDEKGRYADMASDTRTFIYEEVITSAIDNNYVLFGRTPARGNDTYLFQDIAEDLKTVRNDYNIKYERNANEVCFPNIFTWLGLIGMLLYIGIYLMASFQGVYKSNNIYVKLIGIYVAFNFMYGWVENATCFDILNITYWLMISICLSPKFRSMSDNEFKLWINQVF